MQPISYSSARGGISQITEKGDTTASFLLVQQARLTDSGSYACHASVGTMEQVMVHVIRSKKPEQLVPSTSNAQMQALANKIGMSLVIEILLHRLL